MRVELLSLLLGFCVAAANFAGVASAQESRKPLAESEATAPLKAESFSKEAPSPGFASASVAQKMLVARGGWSLSFTVGETTGVVFEYGQKGYESQVKYLGKSGSGVNEFLYYGGVNYNFQMAVRNQPSGGLHQMYISNAGGAFVEYANGAPFPMQ